MVRTSCFHWAGEGTSLIPSQGTKIHKLGIWAPKKQKNNNKAKQMNKQNGSYSKINRIDDDNSNKM